MEHKALAFGGVQSSQHHLITASSEPSNAKLQCKAVRSNTACVIREKFCLAVKGKNHACVRAVAQVTGVNHFFPPDKLQTIQGIWL